MICLMAGHYINRSIYLFEDRISYLLLPNVSLCCIPPLQKVLSLFVFGKAEEYPGIVKVFVDSCFSVLLLLGLKVECWDILLCNFRFFSRIKAKKLLLFWFEAPDWFEFFLFRDSLSINLLLIEKIFAIDRDLVLLLTKFGGLSLWLVDAILFPKFRLSL